MCFLISYAAAACSGNNSLSCFCNNIRRNTLSTDYADYTARLRPQPNVTLAPEEPNVYRSNYESKTCAPAERDVSGNGTRHRLTFRSSGARRNLLEVARSINIRSLRDEGNRLENLVKKQEVRPLYYRARLRDHESNTGGSPKTSAVRP